MTHSFGKDSCLVRSSHIYNDRQISNVHPNPYKWATFKFKLFTKPWLLTAGVDQVKILCEQNLVVEVKQ